jgi:uncharacterized membrane protein
MRLLDRLRTPARWAVAAGMAVAGTGHFLSTEAFLGQTPDFLPFRREIVWVSGAVELAFAAALLFLPARRRLVGRLLAAFFVAIFPGNLYQALSGTSSFGLDTDTERWVRLLFQPVFVAAALWVTSGPEYHRSTEDAARRPHPAVDEEERSP